MADLNQRMSTMGINEPAPAGGPPAAGGLPPKQAYIPPHMRATMGRAPSSAPAGAPTGPAGPTPTGPAPVDGVNGVQSSRWATGYVMALPPFRKPSFSSLDGLNLPSCGVGIKGGYIRKIVG